MPPPLHPSIQLWINMTATVGNNNLTLGLTAGKWLWRMRCVAQSCMQCVAQGACHVRRTSQLRGCSRLVAQGPAWGAGQLQKCRQPPC